MNPTTRRSFLTVPAGITVLASHTYAQNTTPAWMTKLSPAVLNATTAAGENLIKNYIAGKATATDVHNLAATSAVLFAHLRETGGESWMGTVISPYFHGPHIPIDWNVAFQKTKAMFPNLPSSVLNKMASADTDANHGQIRKILDTQGIAALHDGIPSALNAAAAKVEASGGRLISYPNFASQRPAPIWQAQVLNYVCATITIYSAYTAVWTFQAQFLGYVELQIFLDTIAPPIAILGLVLAAVAFLC